MQDVSPPPIARLLVTGQVVAQTERHLAYALEMGIRVLHVGVESAYLEDPPEGYDFLPLPEIASRLVDVQHFDTPEYQAAVAEAGAFLRRVSAQFRPDAVHALGMDYMAYICRASGARPLILSAYGFLERQVYGGGLIARDRMLLEGADILLMEPPMQADLCRQIALPGLRVHDYCTGVQGHHFRPASAAQRVAWRRALRVPVQATVIFSARGWGSTYKHMEVLEAFAAALPDLPEPAYLLFMKMERSAITDGMLSHHNALLARADELGVAERLRWLPSVLPVCMAMFYNVADVVVSQRYPDTFPSTVLEALACARPVVVPRLATFRDSVIGRWCAQVEPGNVADLAAALVAQTHRVATAPDLATARTEVLAAYDARVAKERIAAIYAEAKALGHNSGN